VVKQHRDLPNSSGIPRIEAPAALDISGTSDRWRKDGTGKKRRRGRTECAARAGNRNKVRRAPLRGPIASLRVLVSYFVPLHFVRWDEAYVHIHIGAIACAQELCQRAALNPETFGIAAEDLRTHGRMPEQFKCGARVCFHAGSPFLVLSGNHGRSRTRGMYSKFHKKRAQSRACSCRCAEFHLPLKRSTKS
jgi:hypothetical protein